MNRQIKQLGSQRKTSVSDPELRVEKPNLAFKAPTYSFRDSRFLSTRQGGAYYPAVAGLFFVLLVLTVRIQRVKIIINKMGNLFSPIIPVRTCNRNFSFYSANNFLRYFMFLKILLCMEDENGVFLNVSNNHDSYILPPA